MADIRRLFVHSSDTIRAVIDAVDRNGRGVAVVVDEHDRLVDVVTDGDIRRAVLARADIEAPVKSLIDAKRTERASPVTASTGTPTDVLLQMMRALTLRHIPVLDDERRVVDVAILVDIVKDYELPLTAVIVAGGHGTRLRPLTEDTPKPMLPVGDRPLLERLVDQLRRAGIRRVSLTTHYQPEVIESHFGDGSSFGIEIGYVQEETPLGTAGALGGMLGSTEPLLVINGDILTALDFRAFLTFHREHDADLTIAVREQELRVPYGVVETRGVEVVKIVEKPIVRQFINAGVYLLNPVACRYVPEGRRFDMPDLIAALLDDNRRVIGFPLREYWRDIGQAEDYEQAVADVRGGAV
jgi:dTDP-glucose pyrophosphorylase/CBS domain-containing protein